MDFVIHITIAFLRPTAVSLCSHLLCRLDNLVFDARDSGKVLAVLDWELSTIGDPLADLAYACMCYHLPTVRPAARAASSSLSISLNAHRRRFGNMKSRMLAQVALTPRLRCADGGVQHHAAAATAARHPVRGAVRCSICPGESRSATHVHGACPLAPPLRLLD